MAGTQITVAVTQVEEQRKGYNGISLTNYNNETTEPAITQGSVVEVAGALYKFTAQETITGFGSISNSTRAYINLTASGASVTAAWSTSAPTWDTDKQGYYSGPLVRTIGETFKDGSGSATRKKLYNDTNSKIATFANALISSGLVVESGGIVISAGGLVISGTSPTIDTSAPLLLDSGRAPTAILFGAATEDQIYDWLSPALPSIGNKALLHGAYSDTGNAAIRVAPFGERTGVSTLRIEALSHVASSAGGNVTTAVDGDTTATWGSESRMAY